MTSLNLGITMAQEFHRRVIVVDADFRRPAVHALLGIPPGPGLADVLLGGASLEDALVTIPDSRLTVLTAGLPTEQPTELLGSGPMKSVLEQLRARFDRILLDTPPVTPLADAGVLVHLVDGVVLIVRAHRTPRPLVERSLAEMESSKMLGLVLNDASSADDYAYAYGFDRGDKPEGRPARRRPWRSNTAAPPPRR
jgi:capsular exopolysaccharide synthesis family protein